MKIAVSACLLGHDCKYNGGNNRSQKVLDYLEGHEVIPVCPEVAGGLPIPRVPVELKNGTVIENEYPMDDIGFNDSLYTLTQTEVLELLSGHDTVGKLIDKLDEFYDEMFRNEENDELDVVKFSDISKITVSDAWDCDGIDAGMLVAEYTGSTWVVQRLDTRDDEDDEEDEN